MTAFLKACADRLCPTRGTPDLPDPAVRVVTWRRHSQGRYPAVVTVTIRASSEGSRLVIRGAAKEGLIKQRPEKRRPSG